VALQRGETKTLTFTLGRRELQFWSPQAKRWVVEPSRFDVWVGEDSATPLHARLTIEP
jgi:beta-glucosidase